MRLVLAVARGLHVEGVGVALPSVVHGLARGAVLHADLELLARVLFGHGEGELAAARAAGAVDEAAVLGGEREGGVVGHYLDEAPAAVLACGGRTVGEGQRGVVFVEAEGLSLLVEVAPLALALRGAPVVVGLGLEGGVGDFLAALRVCAEEVVGLDGARGDFPGLARVAEEEHLAVLVLDVGFAVVVARADVGRAAVGEAHVEDLARHGEPAEVVVDADGGDAFAEGAGLAGSEGEGHLALLVEVAVEPLVVLHWQEAFGVEGVVGAEVDGLVGEDCGAVGGQRALHAELVAFVVGHHAAALVEGRDEVVLRLQERAAVGGDDAELAALRHLVHLRAVVLHGIEFGLDEPVGVLRAEQRGARKQEDVKQ